MSKLISTCIPVRDNNLHAENAKPGHLQHKGITSWQLLPILSLVFNRFNVRTHLVPKHVASQHYFLGRPLLKSGLCSGLNNNDWSCYVRLMQQ